MATTPNNHLQRQLRDLPAFRAFLRAVEARFYEDIDLPEPVLDLGCGDGHFASVAFDRPLDVGFDPWWGPLQEARGRRAYRVLAQAEGAHMPFPGGHFASCVSNSVLEHIPDLEPVLAEVARVLRPGGRFVFCVPSEHFLDYLTIQAPAYRAFFNRISRHHHCDSPDVWRARLAATGLRLDRHWYYFSRAALRALEWGHYLGAPSVVTKRLTGRWILAPVRANLWVTERLLAPLYNDGAQRQSNGELREGAYSFFIAAKPA
jgi:SAM-dependent methyltransferase